MSTVTKLQWWYSASVFHSDKKTLILACLKTFDSGEAEVIIMHEKWSFASASEAENWLSEDEFEDLSNLLQDHNLDVNPPMIM